MTDLLERVLEHEGFSEKPYKCSEDVWTIGHGLTYLTEDESRDIVKARLLAIRERLYKQHGWLESSVVADVLTEMVFQLGWTGTHNFKNMFAALEAGDYQKAADEMIDSKWAKQTRHRAAKLAGIIRDLA